MDGSERTLPSLVSIPSRRVGDSAQSAAQFASPLVSIPSRRVGDDGVSVGGGEDEVGFHPLKAGRRLVNGNFVRETDQFPSPQGGSETAS